jgi:hypothetical protein
MNKSNKYIKGILDKKYKKGDSILELDIYLDGLIFDGRENDRQYFCNYIKELYKGK